MSRITYVNGRYVPHAQASVHVEDRGYQFADGVYEVCEIRSGELIDEERHLDRLGYSLSELQIIPPVGRAALKFIMRQVIHRNRVGNGLVYLQVTRGVAPRDHAFPKATRAALIVSARPLERAALDARAETGVKVITHPDERWRRPDIKSISLLPNILAKQAAKEQGAQEAWLVDDAGYVTEGSASNAWIITGEGTVVTRQADRSILRGVTRTGLLDVLAALGLKLEERPFSVSEALEASEAFLTGATTLVTPVVRIDGKPIGSGRPGKVVPRLRQAFIKDR